MSFAVYLYPSGAELGKIEAGARARIIEWLRGLGDDPERAGKILKHSGFWSLRVGDYRAIYEIDRAEKRVIVLFIGHRSSVYDDFSKLF